MKLLVDDIYEKITISMKRLLRLKGILYRGFKKQKYSLNIFFQRLNLYKLYAIPRNFIIYFALILN